MNIQKVLHLENMRFLLPDDFSGSLADALRLAADYLDAPKPPIVQLPKDEIPDNKLIWAEFLDVVKDGRKMVATAALAAWNGIGWNELPLKTGGGL